MARMAFHLIVANFCLLFLTIAGNFILIPLHSSLICSAFLIVYLGSHRSLSGAGEDGVKKQMETMERKDALWFPVMAGITLVGLFILFKFFEKDLVNLIITIYIGTVSVFICANEFLPIVRLLFPQNSPVFELKAWIPFSARLSGEDKHIDDHKKSEESRQDDSGFRTNWEVNVTRDNFICVRLASASVLSFVLGFAVTIWYIVTRHWVANNLIGTAMCLQAMESLSLGSFKTGAVLLTLLFFYDIFFVFGTDVMVTVAKSVDAPIKLLFIKSFAQSDADAQFSMLGLGDIVLPGVFVALLLRFDAIRAKLELGVIDHSSTDFSKPIFNLSIAFYAFGLWGTVFVMHIFKHPQPALLYLVPAVLIGSVLAGILNGCIKDLWNFDETPPKHKSPQPLTEEKKIE